MASPPFDTGALGCFLAEASGARRVEIGEPVLLSGGAIQHNWGFEARFAGGTLAGVQYLVLRTDAPTGLPSSLGRLEEFAVLRAVFAAGVTAPEPLFVCADPAVIGKPFFVMRRLAGTAQGREITTDPAFESALPEIAARLGRELARIQTIRPPHHDLAFLPHIDATAHIASFRAYLDVYPQPRPVLEWAIRWLETHIPEKLPPVLCHRDFRTGNYMVSPSVHAPSCGGGSGWGLTGILDWEFAGWGDPDEDIGWLCCKGWRFARLDRELGGIAGRAPFYKAYEAASTRPLDPERVRFWEVLANVRWAVIALQQSDRVLIGGARDLATAIIGRRAAECELELLLLLDRAPHPTLPRKRGRVGEAVSAPAPEYRDRPSGIALAGLGREWLLDELRSLVTPERQRELRLVATAIGMAEREAAIGDAPAREIAVVLAELYRVTSAAHPLPNPPPQAGAEKIANPPPHTGAETTENPPPLAGEGRVGVPPLPRLSRRFARDLRAGAFEACGSRAQAVRAILWEVAIIRLRESNPSFLAAHGFGD